MSQAFPNAEERLLQMAADEARNFAEELVEWLSKFNPQRRNARTGEIPEEEEFKLAQAYRELSNIYRSSRSPAAIAVFGPSQVGKSLLVGRVLQPLDPRYSALGRDENSKTYRPGLSFERDLNPSTGSNEATALMTRFTTKDRSETPLQDYPVQVRALSRAEWLRVLARGFQSECEKDEISWHREKLESEFAQLRERHSAGEVNRAWRLDLLEVYEFMHELAKLRFPVEPSYFSGLLGKTPLSRTGYETLAANLFWDGWDDITGLFAQTCKFLEELSGKQDSSAADNRLYVQWEVVRFLLDSQQKEEHFSDASKEFPQPIRWTDIVADRVNDHFVLAYRPGQGPPRYKLRIIQAALQEMAIPVLPERMNPTWSAVLASADLLDIPGLRAASKGDGGKGLTREEAAAPDSQSRIVKRGKVSYLFKRYVEQSQIQTLLVLFRGDNTEVRGLLKESVYDWGVRQYGEDVWPTMVRDADPALLIGLTGIDREIKESGHPDRHLYETRIKNLTESLGDVIANFGGGPFQNIFPLRYPGIWDETEEGRRAFGEQRWQHARQGFLDSQAIGRHVKDREQRWDAAMRDGDGGIALVARSIGAVTSSRNKYDKLKKEYRQAEQTLLGSAVRWVKDENVNAERQVREELAGKIVRQLREANDGRSAFDVFDCMVALEKALCPEEGDILRLADLEDVLSQSRRNESFEIRFPSELKDFLVSWGRDLAPSRWKNQGHGPGGQGWLSLESFSQLSGYLSDYLQSEPVFRSLNNQLLRVIRLKNRRPRRRYVQMVISDYILNPGPPGPLESPPPGGDANGSAHERASTATAHNNALNGGHPGPRPQPFVAQWEARLPRALADGVGASVQIPPGNSELRTLIEEYRRRRKPLDES